MLSLYVIFMIRVSLPGGYIFYPYPHLTYLFEICMKQCA